MAGDNWDAVAEAVRDRRAELDLTLKELAVRSGVSESTIRQLSKNYGPRKRSRHTLEDLSKGLQWPGDHLARILDGDASGNEPENDDELRSMVAALRVEIVEMRTYVTALADRIEGLERRRPR